MEIEVEPKDRFQNTPMTATQFERLEKLAIASGYRANRSAYVRHLIDRAWTELQLTHAPSLQPTPNAGQASAGNLRETCGESANG